jgi:hypothetical protein
VQVVTVNLQSVSSSTHGVTAPASCSCCVKVGRLQDAVSACMLRQKPAAWCCACPDCLETCTVTWSL